MPAPYIAFHEELCAAIRAHNLAWVLAMLAHPLADPSYKDHDAVYIGLESTPLIAQALLNHPRTQVDYAHNRIARASVQGASVAVARMVLRHPDADFFDETHEDGSAAYQVLEHYRWDVLEMILDEYVPGALPAADEYARYMLKTAVEFSDAQMVRVLLADGRTDPRALFEGKIYRAVVSEGGPYTDEQYLCEIVQLLNEDGRADPAAGGNAALQLAQQKQLHDVTALLLQ